MKTNKLILLLLLSLSITTGHSQSKLATTLREKEIGTDLRSGSPVMATEILFPDPIYHTAIDTLANHLTIQLRGVNKNGKYKEMGDILVYDLVGNRIKWSKRFYYNLVTYEQHDGVLIKKEQNKSYCLNPENGEELWEIKNYMNYYEPVRRIGIGYNSKTFGKSDRVEGIDLTSGKPLWEREIEVTYGWGEVQHLSDSVLLIVASGLHTVNLNDGSGWDYKTITGMKMAGEAAAKNTAGIALGVLTGTYVFSYTDVVRNINSNILSDSSGFWFTSREKIARIGRDGQEVWATPLPEELTSRSTLVLHEGTLYLINRGWANRGGKVIDFGAPYLAAFDPQSGKQRFFTNINKDKDQVNGFKFLNDGLLIVFKNRISKFSLSDGTLLMEKSFNMDLFQELKFFTGGIIYLKNDETFVPLAGEATDKHFVYTESGKTLELNTELEITNQLERDQLYVKYLETKGYYFLENNGETYLIDRNHHPVVRLNISDKALLIGSKLYDIQQSSFLEVEMRSLINE